MGNIERSKQLLLAKIIREARTQGAEIGKCACKNSNAAERAGKPNTAFIKRAEIKVRSNEQAGKGDTKRIRGGK